MSNSSSIRIRALADVLNGKDSNYLLRRLFRWYSKTFHTALAEVSELPLEDILRVYWEEIYENLEEPELEDERMQLLESEQDRSHRLAKEEEELSEADAYAARVAAAESGKPTPIPQIPVAVKPRDEQLPVPRLPENVKIVFDESLDLDGYGHMAPPRKQS